MHQLPFAPADAHGMLQSKLSGLTFSTGDGDALTATILARLKAPVGGKATPANLLISYINPHVFNLSYSEAVVRQCLEKSGYLCVDGIGVKLALLLLRRQRVPRVVAEHLFNQLVQELTAPTDTVLIGTSKTEVELAAHALQTFQPHLNIIDTLDGFSDEVQYTRFLNKHHDIPLLLIGAGSPKSETIALQAYESCNASVIFHIGAGTIKTWAGSKRRGPAWISALGLEWVHRMIFEPHTRLRYTKGALLFAKNLMAF